MVTGVVCHTVSKLDCVTQTPKSLGLVSIQNATKVMLLSEIRLVSKGCLSAHWVNSFI